VGQKEYWNKNNLITLIFEMNKHDVHLYINQIQEICEVNNYLYTKEEMICTISHQKTTSQCSVDFNNIFPNYAKIQELYANVGMIEKRLDNVELLEDQHDITQSTFTEQIQEITKSVEELRVMNTELKLNNDVEISLEVKSISSDKHNIVQLKSDNLIKEAISFHQINKLGITDLLGTVQEMLETERYILSETFTSTKLNFEEANTYFLSAIAPKKINKDNLQKLLFNNVVCDDLI
jgi:hypothetical protein